MVGIWRQFLLGFGHESYRENLQRLGADRDVDVEVNSDEVVTEGGVSRCPHR
jgi:hypothetical protein